MNRAILLGNVGRDPEIRQTSSGVKVANFTLATNKRWTDRSGEKKQHTEWHTIVVWRDGLVGVIEQFVKKGKQLLIEGEIQTRKWQDQQGNDRYSTEIIASSVQLLGDGAGASNRPPMPDEPPASEERYAGGNGAGGSRGVGPNDYKGPAEPKRSGGFDKALDDEIPFAPEFR